MTGEPKVRATYNYVRDRDGMWKKVGWGGADASMPVTVSMGQPLATYWVSRGPSSGSAPVAPSNPAPVQNVDKVLLVGWHTASSVKTVRIKSINVSALVTQNTRYLYSVYRCAAVPIGGEAIASRSADIDDPESEMQWMYESTVPLGTQVVDGSICDKATPATNAGHDVMNLYQWQDSGQTKPITVKSGMLDGIVITSRSTGNSAPDAIITIEYTEED